MTLRMIEPDGTEKVIERCARTQLGNQAIYFKDGKVVCVAFTNVKPKK